MQVPHYTNSFVPHETNQIPPSGFMQVPVGNNQPPFTESTHEGLQKSQASIRVPHEATQIPPSGSMQVLTDNNRPPLHESMHECPQNSQAPIQNHSTSSNSTLPKSNDTNNAQQPETITQPKSQPQFHFEGRAVLIATDKITVYDNDLHSFNTGKWSTMACPTYLMEREIDILSPFMPFQQTILISTEMAGVICQNDYSDQAITNNIIEGLELPQYLRGKDEKRFSDDEIVMRFVIFNNNAYAYIRQLQGKEEGSIEAKAAHTSFTMLDILKEKQSTKVIMLKCMVDTHPKRMNDKSDMLMLKALACISKRAITLGTYVDAVGHEDGPFSLFSAIQIKPPFCQPNG